MRERLHTASRVCTNTRTTIRRRLRHHPRRPRRFSACAGYVVSEKDRKRESDEEGGRKRGREGREQARLLPLILQD